jgi:hypothetical protein
MLRIYLLKPGNIILNGQKARKIATSESHWVMKALGFTAIVGSLFGIWIDIHRLHNDKKHHTPLNF